MKHDDEEAAPPPERPSNEDYLSHLVGVLCEDGAATDSIEMSRAAILLAAMHKLLVEHVPESKADAAFDFCFYLELLSEEMHRKGLPHRSAASVLVALGSSLPEWLETLHYDTRDDSIMSRTDPLMFSRSLETN